MLADDRELAPANSKRMISSKDDAISALLAHWLPFHRISFAKTKISFAVLY
jgi:hypothetical protein